MRAIRYLLATSIFIVACPLSWYLAWRTSGFLMFLVSFIMPTLGLFDFLISNFIGGGFLQSLLIWPLGLVGAFISLTLIHSLIREKT